MKLGQVEITEHKTTIYGVEVYIDQEGVAWDKSCGVCPACYREDRVSRTKYDRITEYGFFLCLDCGCAYDEPVWYPAESAYVTTISDDDAATDPDPGIRYLYDHYHAS